MADGKFRLALVKRSNGEAIPENEPIFVLRARDNLAVPLLKEYLRLSKLDVCTDYQIDGAESALRTFELWAKANPTKMKQPGVTRGK